MTLEQTIFDAISALLIEKNITQNVDRHYENQFDDENYQQIHESVLVRFNQIEWQKAEEDKERPQYGILDENDRTGVMTLEVYTSITNAASAQHTTLETSKSKDSAWLDFEFRDKVKRELHNFSSGCGYFRLEINKEELFLEDKTHFVHKLTFLAHVCDLLSDC
ncbi:hypothetical protein V9L05_18835 [Bernardetia sp. Wsw4-3y2]|uniref:hypothetical protein n=1 Tax=Bernardetia sp. Wsw4-3y2 TaxID=3127471 RepID=UPI0030CC7F26